MSVYQRKIDKAEIPICNILGVDVAAINMDWLIKYISDNMQGLSGDYICVANVHTTVMAFEQPGYLQIQNGGIMSLPDGGPLSSIGRKRGYTEMERITGPDLMEEIFKISVKQGYRHYFYGATEETLQKLKRRLLCDYPGIGIAGMYSPPFSPEIKEDKGVAEQINKTEPDLVWVGLGAPKQERWMAVHQGMIHGLMIGVGAGFDYFAGNIKRAPKWMQKLDLEWSYRLMQEPKRLFKRYLHTNMRFIWEAVIKRR